VLGDEARLVQVVQNLLDNAAKYTAEGGRIGVRAWREEGDVLLAIKDNGIGMEPEMLDAAFELFRQGHQTLDRADGGLGVGLTLVQRLVTLHGGTVQARSAGVGMGSEFVVRLAAAAGGAGSARSEQPPAPPARSLKVLIVDDNQDAANALRLLLEGEGHEVRTATDGVAGLALAREYRPEYLLLDIGLPRLSGYDIASSLRADPAMNDTTIVAITGYGRVHDKARSAAVGFDHHLTKPVEFTALQELLRARR
jgi:CheY-like chemotaxis protein